MNPVERRAAMRRLAGLVNDAWELVAHPARVGLSGSLLVDEGVFLALKTGGLTVLRASFGEDHAYTSEFVAQVKGPYAENAEIAARILESALADLQALEEQNIQSGIVLEDMLHPVVVEHAYRHFLDEDYREAVFNAAVAVFDLLRTRTGLDLDGSQLATQALGLQQARLHIADLTSETGRSEQIGVMQMLQGFYSAARNPKAHTLQHRTTRAVAAEYLIVASYLARRITEASLPAAF